MNSLKSLGYKTDLMLLRHGGSEIVDRGDYLAISTPHNPGFHWGNFLLFANAPRENDFARWTDLFRLEFARKSAIKHVTFAWDAPNGETGVIKRFVESGFEVDTGIVLRASGVRLPAKNNPQVKVRPISDAKDWEAALQLQIECRDPKYQLLSYAPFMARRFETFHSMAKAGIGGWHGAYLNDELIGDLGIFVENGIGRFQGVETHAAFRRQGVCGTLVHHVSTIALSELGATELVMLADAEYHAAKIYESVGFVPHERLVALTKPA